MFSRPPYHGSHVLSIADLQREATKKLPRPYAELFNEGATDMTSMCENTTAYDRHKIRPRVLVKVPNIDTSAVLFGSKVTGPLGFAPIALNKLAHPDGELATSRAVANLGIGMTVPGIGLNPYAIQLTILKNWSYAVQMLKRAEAAGYKAVFLTVDYPILGIRHNELRNEMALPDGIAYPNVSDQPLGEGFPDIEYDQLARSLTRMELWVKGIYTPEDVVLAIEHGVDRIVISNHGGRQLDGVPATLDVVRECASIATGKVSMAFDGGIRRGPDIFKALSLGAQHCFLGRVPVWGLAYGGQAGVELAVKIFMHELKVTMALAGCKNICEISRTHLAVVDPMGVLCEL
ncbi:alpha-hydroxy acid oxidase [Aspergillus homomorphus CBS 101889]|uniref:FMN-dependent dehydrogenase n=1 Tax=Aspergillus homomorphus (strain CBS 101889) TaxID=1450537 RepID=A0A395HIZ8_ASPHC|nr:FMN-dependent dehydrogenase [Aspergillus homomorphus CBS 101889]RAL07155.1 FMN-dependent dehydrogenase [Aspergillus homomorphus CBS 101889]